MRAEVGGGGLIGGVPASGQSILDGQNLGSVTFLAQTYRV